MSMAFFVRSLLVGVVVAAATWLLGWWGVPLVGLIWGLVRGTLPAAWEAALGAALAWGALIALQARHEEFARLGAALDGLLPVPMAGLIAITLLLAALLAGTTSRAALALR